MNDFLFGYRWKLVGVAFGAAAGFAYWYFIGCTSGTCPIQSHWQSSILYGALIGYILPKRPAKKKEKKDSEVAEQK
jgi:hypothetical protein